MTEPSSTRYTAGRTALRTALIMALFALVFTFLMAATHRLTQAPIQKAKEAERMRLIGAILPPSLYDNDVLLDKVGVPPHPLLDARSPTEILRARHKGQNAALIVESAAMDGYSGKIRLLVAVSTQGQILGVRVLEHRETPGLGDYIDPAKDRQKDALWIDQFSGLSLAQLSREQWQVTKDGGTLAYRAGATISARAVIAATRRALAFVQQHQDSVFETPSGALFLASPVSAYAPEEGRSQAAFLVDHKGGL